MDEIPHVPHVPHDTNVPRTKLTRLHNLHEIMVDASDLSEKIGSKEDLLYQSTAQYDENGIARLKTVTDKEITTQSFQLLRARKVLLDDICRNNNTTASAFLRECTHRLLEEYGAI